MPSANSPETILMAGPPGAGKTEFAQGLVEVYGSASDKNPRYVLLDPDAIRETFSAYTGDNAALFNSAVNLATDKILDHVYKHNQNVIIDGTLAHLDVSRKNIDRALRHNRAVAIIYVFQEPILAWNFTRKREALQKRRVSKDTFIEAFIMSRNNAHEIKSQYGNRLKLHIVTKDSYNKMKKFHYNVNNIDSYVNNEYSIESLQEALNNV